MSVTEYERHQIFQWYDEAMDRERASIMMKLLPPVGWGVIATKADLAMLGSSFRAEMSVMEANLRGEIALLRGEMHREIGRLLRILFFAIVISNATLVGLVFTAVRLGA